MYYFLSMSYLPVPKVKFDSLKWFLNHCKSDGSPKGIFISDSLQSTINFSKAPMRWGSYGKGITLLNKNLGNIERFGYDDLIIYFNDVDGWKTDGELYYHPSIDFPIQVEFKWRIIEDWDDEEFSITERKLAWCNECLKKELILLKEKQFKSEVSRVLDEHKYILEKFSNTVSYPEYPNESKCWDIQDDVVVWTLMVTHSIKELSNKLGRIPSSITQRINNLKDVRKKLSFYIELFNNIEEQEDVINKFEYENLSDNEEFY